MDREGEAVWLAFSLLRGRSAGRRRRLAEPGQHVVLAGVGQRGRCRRPLPESRDGADVAAAMRSSSSGRDLVVVEAAADDIVPGQDAVVPAPRHDASAPVVPMRTSVTARPSAVALGASAPRTRASPCAGTGACSPPTPAHNRPDTWRTSIPPRLRPQSQCPRYRQPTPTILASERIALATAHTLLGAPLDDDHGRRSAVLLLDESKAHVCLLLVHRRSREQFLRDGGGRALPGSGGPKPGDTP
jgi:hypothetical protein